ncbi:HoxN/HupN/NixA family nickel/cobalt transporter [Rhodococcus sp. BP-252]|uniref:Nickel/cobalt efflux system n=1 Tax=Rhodococcoides kyotonense TaxID=398843 RepID=A0A177YDJ2_9NOCA|nr:MULTISPECIES: HoxN/HupN/NixA family nickel/cobalt transporter [Rhodococcus]MBY6413659.1 HoxN/HupN/NixA family nickel/cobalt transporter [Rhodococcus sp. BP-320]MBY6418354.1 HoxN/HupN/NixA family nickel/cobalt transporter [Rhodococcus sp. BP-321]MBY6422479.1 HoxN/HupN/NixA family nickel/cobalt transporter [Rhodococcus sp. BP-324]MBY6428299.1 HoxN/HupN/NixA family nickel/cobalt transporter [Rhodococcus sp. BP-323]MBY6433476.1 HoxN/HupN/NixA family nickel/cobalt transporter [Rhodococcus sp. BP
MTTLDRPAATSDRRGRFTRDEIPRLVGMFVFIAGLHVVGWGLFAHYDAIPRIHELTGADGTLVYAGAGVLAYTLGMRHAFDADHIAAIDDTTRFLLQKGKRPLAVGLFFSLGHSTVVFVFVAAIAVVAAKATAFQDAFAGVGGIIGTLVSGGFLFLIAVLNFAVLAGIVRVWRRARAGEYSEEHLDELLAKRGLLNRIFRGRYDRFIKDSWQMYPLGLLFGLGFDTATQVGLLAVAGTTAMAGGLPPLAIIALPIIFAAGMTTMDTIDGIFMSKAYGWAFVTPIRKIYYNITMTSLSIFVAVVIGSVQLLSLLGDELGLTGQPWDFLASIDLNLAGQFVVGTFFAVWIGALVYYKVARIE